MGGTTNKIEENSLVEAINKLIQQVNTCEQHGLFLDSISIFIKDKGKYVGIGNNGIEMDIGTHYIKKPKKKVVIYFHTHS